VLPCVLKYRCARCGTVRAGCVVVEAVAGVSVDGLGRLVGGRVSIFCNGSAGVGDSVVRGAGILSAWSLVGLSICRRCCRWGWLCRVVLQQALVRSVPGQPKSDLCRITFKQGAQTFDDLCDVLGRCAF